jgi:hypothetical protein
VGLRTSLCTYFDRKSRAEPRGASAAPFADPRGGGAQARELRDLVQLCDEAAAAAEAAGGGVGGEPQGEGLRQRAAAGAGDASAAE